MVRVSGLNHITLAVRDIDQSVYFYRDVLGFRIRALWPEGAYLEAGELWLCLSLDDSVTRSIRADYTHIAFDVAAEDFAAIGEQLRDKAPIWKSNRSEGASLYILDPDGHRLELHSGSVKTRLEHYRDNPFAGLEIFD